MLYKQIECPTCGNMVTATSASETQKCPWCRRLFKVKIERRNKEGRKGKFNWSIEVADFEEPYVERQQKSKQKPKSLNSYMDKDIYGV